MSDDTLKPLSLRIRLPFSNEPEFIARYGAHVTRTSIFIATRGVKPVGSELVFELVLQDSTPLLRGEGIVAQVVENAAPGKNGMTVRFVRLDAHSRSLLDRIVPPEAVAPPTAAPKALPAADVVLGIDVGASGLRAAVWHAGALVDLDPAPGAVLRGGKVDLTVFVDCCARLKQSGERLIGATLDRAVLAVPASLNARERRALGEAALRSGLTALRWINAPAATALGFGDGRGLARKRLLIVDYGASCLDVAIVEMTGDDLEVVAAAGDSGVGGSAFDEKISEQLIARFTADQRSQLTEFGREVLRKQVEAAKRGLSDQPSAKVELTVAAGAPIDFEAELTAEIVKPWLSPLIDRAVELIRTTLSEARIAATALDEVLLVGGQCRLPLLKVRLEELLGPATRTDVELPASVARGAALFGRHLSQRERGTQGGRLSEVLTQAIGFATRTGSVHRVLDRNTRLPTEKTLPIRLENAATIRLGLVQGNRPLALENEWLHAISLPSDRAGELLVRVAVDADGRIEVRGVAPDGKPIVPGISEPVGVDLIAASPLAGEPLEPRSGFFQGLRRKFLGG